MPDWTRIPKKSAPLTVDDRAEWAEAPDDGTPPRDAGRTVAVWHPAMSDATYGRLLRLLFDPEPDDGGGGPTTGKAA